MLPEYLPVSQDSRVCLLSLSSFKATTSSFKTHHLIRILLLVLVFYLKLGRKTEIPAIPVSKGGWRRAVLHPAKQDQGEQALPGVQPLHERKCTQSG